MPIFIKLKDKDRKNLFIQSKVEIKGSWEKLGPLLNTSRTMLFNYIKGKYDIPEKIFLRLEKISRFKIRGYEKISKNRYTEKIIKEPRMNRLLAEIFGILNGDGHISKVNHEICVVGSALEKDYLLYVKNMFEKNLNLKFKIEQQNNKLKVRTYSKNLANLLNTKYGIPKGNKLGKLKVPKQVYKSKKLLTSYVRGLFDTDGSIYQRRKKDTVIEIISADRRYLKEIKKILILNLGIKVGVSGKNLYIYKKKDIKRFFEKIRPANSKHLKKYNIYLN
ncbi:hypothetical protein HY500_01475 [Candidatus Woesearchaeota archaeon]|nr:hypothetical protein [Candidatus Woesearchaeota archaeon]